MSIDKAFIRMARKLAAMDIGERTSLMMFAGELAGDTKTRRRKPRAQETRKPGTGNGVASIGERARARVASQRDSTQQAVEA